MATSSYLPLKKWDVPGQMTLLTDLLTFVSVGACFPGETAPCFNSQFSFFGKYEMKTVHFVLKLGQGAVCREKGAVCREKRPWRQSGVFL